MEQHWDELAARAEQDQGFTERLESDPIATLEAEGWIDLADAVRREQERIGSLVARLAEDEEFRRQVEGSPAALTEWGIPTEALEPVLYAIGAPDEVVERASTDVEAHISGATKASLAAATTVVLGAFAFAGQASAATAAGASPQGASAAAAPSAQIAAAPAAEMTASPAARTGATPSAEMTARPNAQMTGIRWIAKPSAQRVGAQRVMGRFLGGMRTTR